MGFSGSLLVGLVVGFVAMVVYEARDDNPFGPVGTFIPGPEVGTMPKDDFEPYEVTREPFPCGEETCEGWLYFPREVGDDDGPIPVVIVGHGLGLQKDCNLERMCNRMVLQRMAVLLFDYRGFGGSGGVPRHIVHPRRQVEDWEAAVRHVSSGALGRMVDAKRIGVWGYSYGGGHTVVVGSKHSAASANITAVVSSVPYLDPIPALLHQLAATYEVTHSYMEFVRLVALSLQDAVRGILGLPPLYVHTVGNPGDTGVMTTPDSMDYVLLVPGKPLGGWQNKIAARFGLYTLFYRPMSYVAGIERPWLVISALGDSVCPAHVIRKAVEHHAKKGVATLLEYDAGHFDLYPAINADISFEATQAAAEWLCTELGCLGPTPLPVREKKVVEINAPPGEEGKMAAGRGGGGGAEAGGVGVDRSEL